MITRRQLDIIIASTMGSLQNLRETKGAEYANDAYNEDEKDVLDNFRRHAKELNLPMETILAVYAAKHWDAILTYVKDIQAQEIDSSRRVREASEPVDGRVDDLINYLLLFKAMLEERRQETQANLPKAGELVTKMNIWDTPLMDDVSRKAGEEFRTHMPRSLNTTGK